MITNLLVTDLQIAQLLRDKGMPQNSKFRGDIKERKIFFADTPRDLKDYPDNVAVWIADQLIDFLGENFGCLRQIRKGKFEAEDHKGIIVQGKTSVEALAKLVLTFLDNKKDVLQ